VRLRIHTIPKPALTKTRYVLINNNKSNNMKKDSSKKCDKPQKFALGGIAKIRLDQSTKNGMPKAPKSSSNRGASAVYY